MEIRLRDSRKAKVSALEELAAMVGSDKGYLSQIEHGVKPINSRLSELMSNALECQPADPFAPRAEPDAAQVGEPIMALEDEDRSAVLKFAKFLLGKST